MVILDVLKEFLIKKYDTKNLGEVQTIIRWQINRNAMMGAIKIDQSVFIKDLVIEKRLTNYNTNVISMKVGSLIKIGDPKNYKETDLWTYQQLIGKPMYLAYSTRPNITFVVRQLSKQNVNPKKGHL